MRRLIFAAVACLLAFTYCKKNTEQISQANLTGEMVDVSVTASHDSDKVTIDGLSVEWVEGDKLYVVGSADGYLGCLENKGNTLVFTGSIMKTTEAQNYYFYYVGDNSFDLTGADKNIFTLNVANQYGILSGNANSIANKFMLLKGTLYVENTPDGRLGSVTLSCMTSIVRMNLQVEGTSMTSGTVNVIDAYTSMSINTKTGNVSSLQTGIVTLNNASGSYYVAVIPGDQTTAGTSHTFKFKTTGNKSTKFKETIAKNKFYNSDDAKQVNMEDPKFSVASGSKVKFSTGNMYYNGSKFMFEQRQYDYRTWAGGPSCINGTVSSEGTPSSHCGLFYWENYARMAESYSTSYTGSGAATSDVFFTNATNTTPNTSFHVNNETGTNTWRILTADEWDYLFEPPYLGGRDEEYRFALATLNGVHGMILFPDKYFGVVSGDGIGAMNTVSEWPATSIPSATWTSMETDGAIFLPAAGMRSTDTGDYVGVYGYYWGNAYKSDKSKAHYLMFYNTYIYTTYNIRSAGLSVRLARNVN